MTGKKYTDKSRGHFFHVTYNTSEDKWHVKEVKAQNYDSYDSKEEAIAQAEEKAKNVEQGHVVIHREDGKFDTVESF